jgi:hypothetical protein
MQDNDLTLARQGNHSGESGYPGYHGPLDTLLGGKGQRHAMRLRQNVHRHRINFKSARTCATR